MATITTRAGKGSPLTNSELDANFTNLNTDKIELTDLSVGAEGTASGDGSITYSNSTGVFTYTPPDLSGYQTTTGLDEAVDDRVNTLLQAGLGIDLTYDDINNELTIDSSRVEVNCTNNSGASIPIGTPVYQTGVSGNNITIAPADADVASKMPAIGITTSTLADTAEGTVVILGVVTGLDTSSFTAGQTLYISTTAGALTATKPTGESSLIQNFARVLKVNASNGSLAVMGAGRSNDVPNLANGNVFIGNSSNVAEKRALLEADISDLGAYLEAGDLSVTTNAAGTASLSYSGGVFTYTPPDLSGYLTSFTETNDLTAAVTWANVPDANITQSSVTQHQAALSITESQISDLGTYLTDAPSDGNQYARQDGGWSTITAGASLDDATALAIALG